MQAVDITCAEHDSGGVKLACVHGRCWAAAFAVAGLRAQVQVWPASLAGRVRAGRRAVQVQCRHGHGRTFYVGDAGDRVSHQRLITVNRNPMLWVTRYACVIGGLSTSR